MRATNRLRKSRGFTLVELMIVVAIIGILAALAIYGVSRYLNSAKTAEARNNVGAIARGGAAAWERRNTPSELLPDGTSGSATTNALCLSAAKAVPDPNPPAGVKYQPSTATGADFNAGDSVTGWQCLRFSITQPIAFQYAYHSGTGAAGIPDSTAAGGPAPGAGATFEAVAHGDLNGDGKLFSTFARIGEVRTGQLVLASEVYVKDEFE